MSLIERLKHKFGIASPHAGRHPIRIFLLEDDPRRCEWFNKRFKGDEIDIACEVEEAKELLATQSRRSSPNELICSERPRSWCTASTLTVRCEWWKRYAVPVARLTTSHS